MGHKDALEKYSIEVSVTICVIDEHGKIAFRTDGEIDREAVEKLLEAYADGEIDEEVIEAYANGDIGEEAIETYADD